DLRTRRALGEVELHAAIQPTRSGGFGDHCIEGQVMGGVTRLTDTGQGAKHERRTDPCGFFHCSSPCGVVSKTFSRAAQSVGEAADYECSETAFSAALPTQVVFNCLSGPTAEDQGSIDPAEGKIVVHHVLVLHRPWCAEQIIQVATAWVDGVQVQRMDIAVPIHHLDAEPGL